MSYRRVRCLSTSHFLLTSVGHLAKKAVDLAVSVSSLKFPPITALASSSTRSKDWEDVVSAHADDAFARTWRVQDKKLGQWAYGMDEGVVQVSSTIMTCCCADHCAECLRDCLWQLWRRRIINGRNQDVEHAIRKRAQDFQSDWFSCGR